MTALSTSKQGSAQTSGPFIKALAPKEVQEASFGRWQASKRSCVLGASSGVVYGGGVVVAASLVFLLTTPTTCCLRVCISTPSCVRIVFSWTQLGGLIGRLCYTHTHTHGRCPCSDLFFFFFFFSARSRFITPRFSARGVCGETPCVLPYGSAPTTLDCQRFDMIPLGHNSPSVS